MTSGLRESAIEISTMQEGMGMPEVVRASRPRRRQYIEKFGMKFLQSCICCAMPSSVQDNVPSSEVPQESP